MNCQRDWDPTELPESQLVPLGCKDKNVNCLLWFKGLRRLLFVKTIYDWVNVCAVEYAEGFGIHSLWRTVGRGLPSNEEKKRQLNSWRDWRQREGESPEKDWSGGGEYSLRVTEILQLRRICLNFWEGKKLFQTTGNSKFWMVTVWVQFSSEELQSSFQSRVGKLQTLWLQSH